MLALCKYRMFMSKLVTEVIVEIAVSGATAV